MSVTSLLNLEENGDIELGGRLSHEFGPMGSWGTPTERSWNGMERKWRVKANDKFRRVRMAENVSEVLDMRVRNSHRGKTTGRKNWVGKREEKWIGTWGIWRLQYSVVVRTIDLKKLVQGLCSTERERERVIFCKLRGRIYLRFRAVEEYWLGTTWEQTRKLNFCEISQCSKAGEAWEHLELASEQYRIQCILRWKMELEGQE